MAAVRGRCLCGDIGYEIENVPEIAGVCHCKNCQRQGGSAFSTMAGVPRSEFTLMRGEPTVYSARPTASGDLATILFCGRCGSPVCTTLASQPDLVFLKIGTLDDTAWFRPQFHVWCGQKQDWVNIEEDVRSH